MPETKPNTADLESARAIMAEFVDDEYVATQLGLEGAIACALAEQRETCAKKCDAVAAIYSRQTDRARIHGVAYKIAASQECAESIRAGDRG